MKYTIFEIYETVITEQWKHYMNNNFRHRHNMWPIYKKWFFRDNPDAPNEDYYSWEAHHMCENWERDIIWMDDERFKYHWPSHYGLIMRIHSEEEANRNGPPFDQG
jgi:hypothetical protein